MKTRLLKEFRLLLPVFMVTIALSVLPQMLTNPQGNEFASLMYSYTPLFFMGGCALMGCILFGSESQYRTFPLLLSQPISRKAIWGEKMLALGATLLISLVVMLIYVRWDPNQDFEHLSSRGSLALISLCAFCTAPFWTLVLRNTINAIAISLIAPIGMKAVLESIDVHLLHGRLPEPVYFGSFFLYSAVAYLLGYKIFLRLELAGSDAGPAITLPEAFGSRISVLADKLFSRFDHPLAVIIAKEIRLQRSVFLIAGGFVLLVLMAASAFIFRPTNDTVSLGMPLLNICFLIYMALIPMVTSALAFAEERNWGVAEWHLTLPVSAFKQWIIKLLVTFITSIVLGLLLPGILYLITSWIVAPDATKSNFQEPLRETIACAYILLLYVLLTSAAIYASSFSVNVIRAILLSFGLIFLMINTTVLSAWYYKTFYLPDEQAASPVSNPASYYLLAIELIVMAFLLAAVTFGNFRFRSLPTKLSALGTTAILLLTGIFTLAFLVVFWTTDSTSDSAPPPLIFNPHPQTIRNTSDARMDKIV